ncbi:MAG: hypothetical protein ACYCYE_12030 [Clostridia bacterium]
MTQESEPQQVLYTGKIPKAYAQIVRDANEIVIENNENYLLKPLIVNYIGQADADGVIDIQCILPTDKSEGIEYGQKLQGKIKKHSIKAIIILYL